MFMDGEWEFNDYTDHVAEWYTCKHKHNVLFLLYENLKKNLQAEILKIAEFLGEEYKHQITDNGNKLLHEITEAATFEAMAKHKNDAWVNN